jgi:hypothetical protein
MPYSHSFLTRGNGHRVLISDIQLLQGYSQRRDIRRNPLPYSIVHNSIMDLLSNRETPAAKLDTPQLLITPAVDHDGDTLILITPAVVQHAVPIPVPAPPPIARARALHYCPYHQLPASDARAERGPQPTSTSPTISALSPRLSAPLGTKKAHPRPYSQRTTMPRPPTPTS